MLVSVVTISFNQLEYLKLNRASVRAQGANVQHVIVDPGSTDGSRAYIEGLTGEPGVVVSLEPDEGPADGLNKGLNLVDGEVWLYLNADDELAPGAIEAIRDAHSGLVDRDVIIGNGWIVDESGDPIRHVASDRFTPRRYALGVGTVLQQATSFKSAATLGSVKFNKENRYNWDTELLFDAHRSGLGFGYVEMDLGYFRMQPSSITMSGDRSAISEERRRLYRTVPGYPAFRLLSPFARAVKRSVRKSIDPPFPGLARTDEFS